MDKLEWTSIVDKLEWTNSDRQSGQVEWTRYASRQAETCYPFACVSCECNVSSGKQRHVILLHVCRANAT